VKKYDSKKRTVTYRPLEIPNLEQNICGAIQTQMKKQQEPELEIT